MRRTTLVLLMVLMVVVLGGGAYLWLKKDSIQWPWITTTNTSSNTNSSVTVVNTSNTTPINASLPAEVKGDTAVAGTLKIGTVDLTVSSQQRYATFNGSTAEKGKEFLVVYFDQVQSGTITVVDRGLRDAVVTDGKTTYTAQAIKVASTAISGDRGYVEFIVPEKAANLKLQLGSGTSLQSITLK